MGGKLRYFCIKSDSVWGLCNLSAASSKSLPFCCIPAWLLSRKLGSSKVTLPLRVNLGGRRTRPSLKNWSWLFTLWPLHTSLFTLIPNFKFLVWWMHWAGANNAVGCEGAMCWWPYGSEAVLGGSACPRWAQEEAMDCVPQWCKAAVPGWEVSASCTTCEIQHSCYVI